MNWTETFREQLENARRGDTQTNWAGNILQNMKQYFVKPSDIDTTVEELQELDHQYWVKRFQEQLQLARCGDTKANWARNILENISEHNVSVKELGATIKELYSLYKQYYTITGQPHPAGQIISHLQSHPPFTGK